MVVASPRPVTLVRRALLTAATVRACPSASAAGPFWRPVALGTHPRGHHAVANWRTGGASRLRSRLEVSCSGLDRSCPCRSSRRRLVTGGPADELPPPRRCRSPRRVLHGAAGGDRPRGLAWPRPRTRSSSCRAPAVPRWDAVEVGAAWAGWSGEQPYGSLGVVVALAHGERRAAVSSSTPARGHSRELEDVRTTRHPRAIATNPPPPPAGAHNSNRRWAARWHDGRLKRAAADRRAPAGSASSARGYLTSASSSSEPPGV